MIRYDAMRYDSMRSTPTRLPLPTTPPPLPKKEARCLARLEKFGVDTPTLYWVDVERAQLVMEWVDGRMVKDVLEDPRLDDHQKLGMFCGVLRACVRACVRAWEWC